MAVGSDGTELDTRASVNAGGSAGLVPFRPAVKALVTDADRVLLVQEEHANGDPFWTLPGGGLDPDETLEDALRREIREELRTGLAIGRPVGVCPYLHESRPGVVSLYVVFVGDLLGTPEPNPADGIRDHAWVDPASPPEGFLPTFRDRLTELLDVAATAPSERNGNPVDVAGTDGPW